MIRTAFTIMCIWALVALVGPRRGVDAATPPQNVTASLVADVDAIAPGESFTLGVMLKLRPHWHVYWLNPGDSGKATEVAFELPDGFTVGELRWPTPVKFTQPGDFVGYGYEGEVLLTAKVTAPATLKAGDVISVRASASWLVCDELTCLEGDAKLTTPIKVAERSTPANGALFEQWNERLPMTADEAAAWFTPVPPGGGAAIAVKWIKPVTGVDWYPAVGPDLLVERVAVSSADGASTVGYAAQRLSGDATQVGGLLVFTDETGRRRSAPLAGPLGRR